MSKEHKWRNSKGVPKTFQWTGGHYGYKCSECGYRAKICCGGFMSIDLTCTAEDVKMELPVDGVLKGMGVSKGTFTGRAVVMERPIPGALGLLKKTDILICHTTDPNWAEAFERVGAVVTEIGSLLCHAAIVSREYKLPCVVNIKGAMQMIPQHSTVEVDGTTGEVKVQ